MKKIVLKLEFYDDKIKQKAMEKVSGLAGVDSIAVDGKDKKLTVTGDVDPVKITAKLRKLCRTEIVSVGPAKEGEKKDDKSKKDEGGKDDAKKGDDNKKKDGKDDKAVKAYPYAYQYPPPQPYYYYPPQTAPAYYARSVEEDPNSCVIC